MSAIVPYLKGEAFDQSAIDSMSMALKEVCDALKIESNTTAHEVVAIRIVELAGRGELDGAKLRDRLLMEAEGGTGL